MPSLHDCPAPAKLNLFLHVTGRRADGYHLLQTVFQLIDHGDLLHFDLRDDGAIRARQRRARRAGGNRPDRARARLLQAEHVRRPWPRRAGIEVAIDKRLPMGGGLGGGSSDAATALMALNHLWQAGLDREELMALGLPLGADMPFFIFGRMRLPKAWAKQLRRWTARIAGIVVIEPGVSVPTPAIFCSPEFDKEHEARQNSGLFQAAHDQRLTASEKTICRQWQRACFRR